ncbi:MAG TPA: carboxypeptidase-like regulatory domain-containing protein, partial [Sphingomicrobium sp.]
VVPIDASRVFATFDLTGRAVGAYDIQATAGNATVATLNDGLTVNVGLGANIVASLSGPLNVLINRNAPFYIDYVNIGDADASVPVFIIENVTGTPVAFTVGGLTSPASTGNLQIVAVDDDVLGGTLRPGERRQIPVVFFVPSLDPIQFRLITITEKDTRQIDYTQIESALRLHDLIPNTIAATGPEFDAAFAQLKLQVGPTYGDYVKMLGRNADLIPNAFGSAQSALPMLRLEFLRAIAATGTSISGRLASTDLLVSTNQQLLSARNRATNDVFTTLSLQDGSFSFERVTPGEYEITADRAMISSAGAPVVAADQSLTGLNLNIARGAAVSGRVFAGATGQLLPGAVVTLIAADGGRSFTATVNADGLYQLTGLPMGTYSLRAEAEGRARTTLGGVVIATNQDSLTRDFNLAPGAEVRGNLLLPTGGESAFANNLETLLITATDVANPANRFTADLDGLNFSVAHLPAGTYQLEIGMEGFVFTSQNVTVTTGETRNLPTTILARAGSISGSIVSTHPQTAGAYALVGLFDGATLISSAQANSAGAFTFTDLQPGAYTLRALVEGGFPEDQTRTVNAGEGLAGIALRILPGGTVAGSVAGSVGGGAVQSIEGVRVFLTRPDGSRLSARTDAQGTYRFTGQGLGAHVVSLATGALATPTTVNVTTLDGTEVRADLTLSAAAKLGGRVTGAGGAVVTGNVSLYEGASLIASTPTDADGNYSFLLLRGGTFSLEAVGQQGTFAP